VHDVMKQVFGAKLSPQDGHKLIACVLDEIAVPSTQVNFLVIDIAGSCFCNVQVCCKNDSERWVLLMC
jgi:hypothetical protein